MYFIKVVDALKTLQIGFVFANAMGYCMSDEQAMRFGGKFDAGGRMRAKWVTYTTDFIERYCECSANSQQTDIRQIGSGRRIGMHR